MPSKDDDNRIVGISIISLLVFASLLFLAGLGMRHLRDADEPREAGITAEMARSGDYVVPRLNGQAFLEKPPLYYWIGSAVFKLFGENTRSARIPSALAAIGGVALVFILARKMGFSPFTAFISGLALATSAEYWSLGRRCLLDMMLCLFTTGAMVCFFQAARSPKGRILWAGGFVLSLACALLTKGLVGLAIPLSALTVWLVLSRDFSLRSWLLLLSGSVLCLIPATIWIWLLWGQLGGETVHKAILSNNFGRFTGGYAEHVEPFYYYLVKFPPQFFPWVLFLPAAFIFHIGEIRQHKKESPSLFILAWFVVPFLLLSVSAGKRGLYLLPLYPAAALFVGQAVGMVIEGKKTATKWFNIPAGILAWAVILMPLALLGICVHFKQPVIAWPLVSAPGLCLGIWAYGRLRREKLMSFLQILVPAFLVLYLTFDIGTAPISNQKESFEPLFEYCRSLKSGGVQIGLVRPKERLSGAAVFYLGGRVPAFAENEDMNKFLSSDEKTAAIVNEADIRNLRDIDVLRSFRIGHDTIVVAAHKIADGEQDHASRPKD
jgi:4-amino-4-deoxy-L-arabinose transferase-like glycosyltransferase